METSKLPLHGIAIIESKFVKDNQIVLHGPTVALKNGLGFRRPLSIYDVETGKLSGNCSWEVAVELHMSKSTMEKLSDQMAAN